MQKPLGHDTHGELVDVSVSGGHEDVAAADVVADRDSKSWTAMSVQGATVGAGRATASSNDIVGAAEVAVRPGPLGLPVS